MLNTKNKFGHLMKFVHWSIALLFMLQFFLVYRRDYFAENAPEKLQYIMLHKSIGVLLLGFAILYLIIRHLGKRPQWPGTMSRRERILAKVTHIGLGLAIICMPLTGIVMSTLSGYGVKFFGISLPALLEVNKPLSSLWHSAHVWISYVVIGLFVLHVLGALVHHFVHKDNVLRRMLPFTSS
jgi:cytochrome b561